VTTTILSETILAHLPSASGVEIIGAAAYVVSDDAPFLYVLDAATLAPVSQIQLFESTEFSSGRIPKATKPDLESIAAITSPNGAQGLLLCGSGALPNRETGYFVGLPAATVTPEATSPRFVQQLDLRYLYAELRRQLPPNTTLNLEAAATTPTELLLLQRPVGGGPALLFLLPLSTTLAHLFEPREPVPTPTRVLTFVLPTVDGYEAGFSGATYLNGRLLITASVEATLDAVADGAVLGSFIGVVNPSSPSAATFTRLTWADGRPYLGKVEGIAVRRQLTPDWIELLLVTDDDQGGSTALTTTLQLV
jgi:hypothetical protein